MTTKLDLKRFIYIRDEKRNPVGCICFKSNLNGETKYGFSICNPSDKFNKLIARNIAEGRMERSAISLNTSASQSLDSILTDICLDITDNGRVLKRVEKFILNMI